MRSVGRHLVDLSIWAVVCGVLGLFVFPHEAWVFLGLGGAALFIVLFAVWALTWSFDDWLADVIRRSRRRSR